MKARPLIEGWTSDAVAAELARLAAGKIVLEVGAFKGFATVLMARAGATVWALDWHRGDSGGDPGLGPRDTACAWWTNVRRHHVEDQVVGLIGRSTAVMASLCPEWFDLVVIDADHAYESVVADYQGARPLLGPTGAIAFHDYCEKWPGVVRAVDEIRESIAGEYAWRLVDSLAIVEFKESSRDS